MKEQRNVGTSSNICLITVLLVFLLFSYTYALNWPVWPDSTNHSITGHYGIIQEWYLHSGIDIVVPEMTPVYAMESGYVKARMTLYDGYSSWRIVVADSAGIGECEGWMYAHIHPYYIAFSVGDYVNAGDSIGVIVGWPMNPGAVEHLHLSRVRFAGDSATWENGFNDWEFIANPLDFIDGIYDPDNPGIEKAWGNQLLAFCYNDLLEYFPEGAPINGDVDIICSLYDYYNFYQWKNIPYIIEYKIEGDSSIPWTTTVQFNEPIGSYNNWMVQYRSVIYQEDIYCTTTFTLDSQAFFFNLTNTDGDGQVEISDIYESWQTPYFHNGEYKIFVRATDNGGNTAVDSMVVTVENYFELSGVVTLETASGDWSGAAVTIASDGQSDTTDINGNYLLPAVPGGTQQIHVSRPGYTTVDTVLLMNENRQLDVTLNFEFLCGDANGDLTVNLLDITFLISYLYKDGATPDPLEAADADGNGLINILDITYLISFLYKDGPAPLCQ